MAGKLFYILERKFLEKYRNSLLLDGNAAIVGLAKAITSSQLFREIKDASVIIRPYPHPTLAVLGNLEEHDISRLDALTEQLKFASLNMRYQNYHQVEEACRKLGQKLVVRFGRETVDNFQFMAIPRGGIVILGILSYILDLDPKQIGPSDNPGRQMIVVDDCCLSGYRFHLFMQKYNKKDVIFAPLYSHPQLRSALENHPQVKACISAEDLKEIPREYDAPKSLIQNRMNMQLGGNRYWLNRSEYICFPWNEPDWYFWNRVTETVESGWHIIPPELCLKNHEIEGFIQVQKEGKGNFRPPRDVIFSEQEKEVIIVNMATEECISLEGEAAVMWKALMDSHDINEAEKRLLRAHIDEESVLRRDYMLLIQDLLRRQMLEDNS
jgi:hypothetical protein